MDKNALKTLNSARSLLGVSDSTLRETLKYKFPNRASANQFAYDVSNAGIATSELSGRTNVEIEILPAGSAAGALRAVAKYMKKSKGKLIKESGKTINYHNWKESVDLDEKVMGALPGGSPTRKFSIPPSPEVKKHILQAKPSEFLWSADSVLGGNSKFVVISLKIVGNNKDGVMMAIISNPDRGSRKIFSYMGTHRNVKLAQKFAKNNKLVTESVELDEAWTADSVMKNAEIGSKKGYGINIKKTGGVTKTPYKHMLMTIRRDKSVRVTFDHGKDEFEGTPKSVALHLNKILGIKESVELDEAFKPSTYYSIIYKGKVFEKGNKKQITKKIKQMRRDDPKLSREDLFIGVTSKPIGTKWPTKKGGGGGYKEESVELDEAHHDQRAADKALFNAMKFVDPKAKWKMVKSDPSRFGVDVEIASKKMAKYGDWMLMAWSDGRMMHMWYEHPNGEGSVPEKEFKRVAKKLMSESMDERHQPLPTATGFRITYPMGNNKQVTKLTNIGGVVDRVNKRIVFSFKSSAARKNFKKKRKDILDTVKEAFDTKKANIQLEALSAKQLKKLGITNPLAGKHYPYQQDEDTQMKKSTLLNRALQLLDEKAKIKGSGPFTAVAIKNKKVVGQFHSVDKKEINDVVAYMKTEHRGSSVSVEDKTGKVVYTAETLQIKVKEALDTVDKKELKKKHKDREDKDIDNDGDADSTDKYLHKRRKAISKAIASKKDESVRFRIRWTTVSENKDFMLNILEKEGNFLPSVTDGLVDSWEATNGGFVVEFKSKENASTFQRMYESGTSMSFSEITVVDKKTA